MQPNESRQKKKKRRGGEFSSALAAYYTLIIRLTESILAKLYQSEKYNNRNIKGIKFNKMDESCYLS